MTSIFFKSFKPSSRIFRQTRLRPAGVQQSAAEVRILQDAERRTGHRVMEAFCHLFHPQYASAQALIEAGKIGRLLAMQSTFGNTLEREGKLNQADAVYSEAQRLQPTEAAYAARAQRRAQDLGRFLGTRGGSDE